MAVSPVLYRIVQGSSSRCLNLIKAAKKTAGKPQLFRKREFARTIIFKYPNFADPTTSGGRGQPERPIETAIYIPHNELEPMAGG